MACLKCGYEGPFSKVKIHMERKHSFGPGHPCPFCDHVARTEEDRSRHCRVVHFVRLNHAELREMAELREDTGKEEK